MIYSVKSVSTYDILFCIYIKSYSCKAVLEEIEDKVVPVPLHKSGICYKFAVLIDNDGTCRNFILHLYMLHFACVLNCKLDICCFKVSVRSKFLTKSVSLSNYKSLDYMCFLSIRCPCVYHISILIKYSKCCTCKLCTACDICLCKLKGCRSVLILAVIYSSLNILSLIFCIKVYCFLICHISGRLYKLPCNIFCKWIILNKSNLSILIRCCLLKKCAFLDNYLAIYILDILVCIKTKYCTCNRCVIFCIKLSH